MIRALSPQIPVSIASPSSSSRGAATTFRGLRARAAARAASPPMPLLNPKDAFLSKLAFIATANPDLVAMPPPSNTEIPPFLDLFDSPKLMATPAQVKKGGSFRSYLVVLGCSVSGCLLPLRNLLDKRIFRRKNGALFQICFF